MKSPAPRREPVVLSYSVLPQDALSEAREAIDGGGPVVERLEAWAAHLARALRIARRLDETGWRVTLLGDLVTAERVVTPDELAALARELKDDLAALTAVAESGEEAGGSFTFEPSRDEVRRSGPDDQHPLV